MKLSVIIPTFNRAKLLKRALKSVFAQTLQPFEVIVVDDGSTDDTKEMVKEFPIKYFYQKNKGVSTARNLGIKNSSGDVIAFLDSDDEWMKDKIKLQLPCHEQDMLFSHTNEIWIRDKKEIKQKSHHKKPDGKCFYENISFCKISPSTVMINKSLFEKVGYFDESLEVCEDFDMWLRVLKVTPVKLIENPLTIKHAGEDSQLSFKYFAMDRFRVEALMKHLPDKKIKNEIEKKLSIMRQGAKRHQNQELLDWIFKTEKTLTTLVP